MTKYVAAVLLKQLLYCYLRPDDEILSRRQQPYILSSSCSQITIYVYYFLSTYLWLNRRRCDELERRLINHHREKSTALWIVTVKSLRPCDSWHLFPTRSRSEQSCRWLCVTCLTWHHRGSWGGHSYQMLIILKKPMVFNHTHSGHRSQLGIGFKSDEHLIVCLKLRNIKTKWLKVIWRAFIHLPLLTYWLTDIWFFSENHKQTRAEVSEADPLAYWPLQG